MAIDSSKPIVVIILDQAAWELLTVPGGAEEAIRDAGDDAWTDGKHAAPLCSYAGEEIIPGVPMSINVMRSLFNRLASINLCPCRELEVENDGYRSVLSRAAEYVQKDLAYFKEHAQLKSKAMAWDQAVRKGGPQPLLQGGEATFWNGWLQSARTHGMEPQPTEMMEDYVGASMRHSRRRKGLMQCLAVLLIVVLAAGVGVSATMALRAEDAQANAESQAMRAEDAQANAETQAEAALQAKADAEEALERAVLAEEAAEQQADAAVFQKEVAENATALALEALAEADKSARLSTAMACASIMNRQPSTSEWELKLLREALARLPSKETPAASSALLVAGRGLLTKPSILPNQVGGLERTPISSVVASPYQNLRSLLLPRHSSSRATLGVSTRSPGLRTEQPLPLPLGMPQ